MLETLSNFMTTVSVTSNSWLNPALWDAATVARVRKESATVAPPPLAKLVQYTLAEVSDHWSPEDCWVIVADRVYDVTTFASEHPGGQYIMMEHAGRDATLAFRGSRHSVDAYNMLDRYLIGELVENERLYRQGEFKGRS